MLRGGGGEECGCGCGGDKGGSVVEDIVRNPLGVLWIISGSRVWRSCAVRTGVVASRGCDAFSTGRAVSPYLSLNNAAYRGAGLREECVCYIDWFIMQENDYLLCQCTWR